MQPLLQRCWTRLINPKAHTAGPPACHRAALAPHLAPGRAIHLDSLPQRRIHHPKHRTASTDDRRNRKLSHRTNHPTHNRPEPSLRRPAHRLVPYLAHRVTALPTLASRDTSCPHLRLCFQCRGTWYLAIAAHAHCAATQRQPLGC